MIVDLLPFKLYWAKTHIQILVVDFSLSTTIITTKCVDIWTDPFFFWSVATSRFFFSFYWLSPIITIHHQSQMFDMQRPRSNIYRTSHYIHIRLKSTINWFECEHLHLMSLLLALAGSGQYIYNYDYYSFDVFVRT